MSVLRLLTEKHFDTIGLSVEESPWIAPTNPPAFVEAQFTCTLVQEYVILLEPSENPTNPPA